MSRFAHQLQELGFASYGDYLGSRHWQDFKKRYRDSGLPMKCAVCGCGPIQLHHHTYIRLGDEHLDDVTPVCREHHKAIHRWLKASGRIFVEYTHEAVSALRGAPVVRKKKPKQAAYREQTKTGKRRRRKFQWKPEYKPQTTGVSAKKKKLLIALAKPPVFTGYGKIPFVPSKATHDGGGRWREFLARHKEEVAAGSIPSVGSNAMPLRGGESRSRRRRLP